jgi:predicted permease
MSWWLHTRHAIRLSARHPGSTALLLLTLALAIGANTAIFSVVDATLFRPLPYPEPDRLVQVVTRYIGAGGGGLDNSVDGATWAAVRDHASTLDAAVYTDWVKGVNFATGQNASFVKHQRVGAGFFRVLGVSPRFGREFISDEDRSGGPAAVILSDALWQRAFGGNPDVIGRSVTLKGEPHTIVGVMPAGFTTGTVADLWTPLRPSLTGEGEGSNYGVVARLRPGVSRESADQELAGIGRAVLKRSQSGAEVRLGVTSLQEGRSSELRQPLLIMWAAVGVVLLIGCANIAGLLLARAAARTREIATRMAIGGGRGAIASQLLIESLLLTAVGAALGIGVGAAVVSWLSRVADQELLPITTPSLDVRVLALTAVVAIVTGVLAGLAPAIEASLVDLRVALSSGGGRGMTGGSRHWSRRLLVTLEVAMAVLLLVGAGLLVRSVQHLNALAPGFDSSNVLAASFSLDDARYASPEKVTALFDDGVARLAQIPGVETAAAGLSLPYERGLNMGARRLDGPEADSTQDLITNLTYVTPDYFAVLRMPLRAGRAVTAADRADSEHVVVVNEAFARLYLSRQEPIGSHLDIGNVAARIVGVVGDVEQVSSFGSYEPVAPIPAVYIPVPQTTGPFLAMVHTWFSPSWIVRTAAPPATAIRQISAATNALDPLLPIAAFRTVDDLRSRSLAWERFQALLLTSLAALALVLAVTGIYGLMSQSVQERRRELGVRLALGGSLQRVLRDAIVPGLVMALTGVALGIVVAVSASRVLRHLLWGVTAADPVTYAAVAAGLLVVAGIAALVPALSITRLDPAETLRDG